MWHLPTPNNHGCWIKWRIVSSTLAIANQSFRFLFQCLELELRYKDRRGHSEVPFHLNWQWTQLGRIMSEAKECFTLHPYNFCVSILLLTNYMIHNCELDETIRQPIQKPKLYMELDMSIIGPHTYTPPTLPITILNWAIVNFQSYASSLGKYRHRHSF